MVLKRRQNYQANWGEFTSLARAGARLDESVPGSGLGLAIVRELISLYSGQMALEKSPLVGLRVVVRLPIGFSVRLAA